MNPWLVMTAVVQSGDCGGRLDVPRANGHQSRLDHTATEI